MAVAVAVDLVSAADADFVSAFCGFVPVVFTFALAAAAASITNDNISPRRFGTTL